jgi:hypothetical protein
MNKISNASKSFLVLIVLFAVCIFNMFPSCSVSTASLSDPKVCSSVGSDGSCGSDASSFPASTPVIYFTATLKNAPSDTKVSFEWKRNGESLGKASVDAPSGVVNSTYKSPGTLEPGKYSVTAKIETDNATPVTKEFTVEAAPN